MTSRVTVGAFYCLDIGVFSARLLTMTGLFKRRNRAECATGEHVGYSNSHYIVVVIRRTSIDPSHDHGLDLRPVNVRTSILTFSRGGRGLRRSLHRGSSRSLSWGLSWRSGRGLTSERLRLACVPSTTTGNRRARTVIDLQELRAGPASAPGASR